MTYPMPPEAAPHECPVCGDVHRAPGQLTDETRPLPPIGQTVRRRPPVPGNVSELSGSALLRALADEMDRNGDGGESL
jgi:hypothetical protein